MIASYIIITFNIFSILKGTFYNCWYMYRNSAILIFTQHRGTWYIATPSRWAPHPLLAPRILSGSLTVCGDKWIKQIKIKEMGFRSLTFREVALLIQCLQVKLEFRKLVGGLMVKYVDCAV